MILLSSRTRRDKPRVPVTFSRIPCNQLSPPRWTQKEDFEHERTVASGA